MSFVIVFLIDDPPRLVIDIFSFQWIRGTFIFKSRYCVTRPRSLLVRNVASRYDPWPIFSSLDRAVQPEFFRRWGSGERGSGRGGNCRADGSLSRNDSGWNWTGNRPIVSFHARFYPLERAAGEIFAGAGGGNDFPFEMEDENDSVGMSDSMLKFFQWEDCIWGIEIWLYISYNFLLECFYWMCGIMEIEISRFICHKFKSFINRLQYLCAIYRKFCYILLF